MLRRVHDMVSENRVVAYILLGVVGRRQMAG